MGVPLALAHAAFKSVLRIPALKPLPYSNAGGKRWHLVILSGYQRIQIAISERGVNCPGFDGGCILWEDVVHVSIEAANAEARIGTPTPS